MGECKIDECDWVCACLRVSIYANMLVNNRSTKTEEKCFGIHKAYSNEGVSRLKLINY